MSPTLAVDMTREIVLAGAQSMVDLQLGFLLAIVVPRESLYLPVVLSYHCRIVCETCKNGKGNDNIRRYCINATITQPRAFA